MRIVKFIVMLLLLFNVGKSQIVQTQETYREDQLLIPQEGLVIVNFWADFCADCINLIIELDANVAPDVTLIHVDVLEHYELAKQLGIESLPFVVFIEDGRIVDSIIGDVKFEMDTEEFKEKQKKAEQKSGNVYFKDT